MGTNNFSTNDDDSMSTVDNGINHSSSSFQSENDESSTQQEQKDYLLPTAEGLIRLRELHISLEEEEEEGQLMNNNKVEIMPIPPKFPPQESLHSFQFSSCSSTTSTSTIRQELLTRKKRIHGTLPGHHKFTNNSDCCTIKKEKTKTVGSPISTNQFISKQKKTTYLPTLSESPPSLQQLKNSTSVEDTITTSRTMSNSSSSLSSHTVSTTPPTTEEEDEEEDEEEEERPIPHLHNRLKQQNQAILTTYDDWRIILTNSIAQDVLVSHLHHQEQENMMLVGKSVMDLVEPRFRNRLKSMIVKKRNEFMTITNEEDSNGGMVLVCGYVIPMIKLDGTKTSASLWLKEKVNQEDGSSVFIWIFEEVYESSFSLSVSDEGIITSIMDEEGIQALWDYHALTELVNQPLTLLIPSLQQQDWKETIQHHRFFGSHTKRGAPFPVIARLIEEQQQVHITSMPMIAGLVTLSHHGIIEGCNDVFVKYLFGYSQQELLGTMHISHLLPQFPILLKNLKRDDLLQPGLIINNVICRKLLQEQQYMMTDNKQKKLTHTPNDQPLPLLMAIHRDGTALEVQLQIKLVDEEEYALWISFDREVALKRYGHDHLISSSTRPKQEKKENKLVYSPTLTIIPSSTPQPKQEEKDFSSVTPKKRPPFISYKSFISEEDEDEDIVYSAQMQSTCIDDYDILDDMGQGAYGFVKLAIKKNDPTQTKVVIKYVVKSRILVDCWTRDRKLGTVPVEIHILHTLRKSPHENLSDMLDYFEDSEHYYIVMGLHGEGMDLFDYIELHHHIPEPDIQRMFKQIALGVAHLHNNKIVHRDIKDENVVLEQASLRLIDFGSAAYLKPNRKYETFVGTLDYAAPEILRGYTYEGPPQDVWALGILLFTLVYRENPFYDIDEIMGRELRIPFVVSEGSVDLIRRMLERDVEKRLDIHQVLAHPWLSC